MSFGGSSRIEFIPSWCVYTESCVRDMGAFMGQIDEGGAISAFWGRQQIRRSLGSVLTVKRRSRASQKASSSTGESFA